MRANHPRPGAETLRGLYAVTSESVCAATHVLVAAVEEALAGGARLVQYRDKRNGADLRQRNAHALIGLCRAHGALLIVNDDVALAAASGADGVHLGASDLTVATARDILGAGALIGVSCGDSLARARAAVEAGADYVAFGRFFPSRTKPQAPPARIETLAAARRELTVPLCAIGGITPANAPSLLAAGANLIAAVEGVFGAADVRQAATAYAALFSR